jgi:hypothetical protein
MLLRRTASWRGPFCFLVDVNDSEASLCSLDYTLLIMKKLFLLYYINMFMFGIYLLTSNTVVYMNIYMFDHGYIQALKN